MSGFPSSQVTRILPVKVLGAEKVAWIEDPEGNILRLHENLA